MLERIKLTPRWWFFLGFVGCMLTLALAAYLQFMENQEPCPLCISQRIVFFLVGLVFLLAAIHNPKAAGIKKYSIAGALTALAGAGIAIRHIWIQHLPPDQVPECGPGLSYVFDNFPLSETLKLMLSGSGDCAVVTWRFLGLSIPEWALVEFLLLAALSLLQIWNKPQNETH